MDHFIALLTFYWVIGLKAIFHKGFKVFKLVFKFSSKFKNANRNVRLSVRSRLGSFKVFISAKGIYFSIGTEIAGLIADSVSKDSFFPQCNSRSFQDP